MKNTYFILKGFFTSKTIVNVPLSDDLPLGIKSKIMQNRTGETGSNRCN